MKIELTRIYNNRPYYTIRHDDGKISHAFGYEQVEKFVNEANAKGEKIELVETKVLEKHSRLVELVNSLDKPKNQNEKTK
jgi:predicted DNA-binding WGR domain protein